MMKRIYRIYTAVMLLCLSMTVSAQTKTIQADFVQTKTMKMLGDKMVSRGKMHYQHNNKLRWEYTAPYTYTFVMNGNKVLLKKGNRKDVINTSKNKMFKEIGRIMMSSIVVTSKQRTMELPLSKSMKSLYKKIILHFNPKTTMVEKVVMYEKNGDTTEIELKNVTTNKVIPAALFAVQ